MSRERERERERERWLVLGLVPTHTRHTWVGSGSIPPQQLRMELRNCRDREDRRPSPCTRAAIVAPLPTGVPLCTHELSCAHAHEDYDARSARAHAARLVPRLNSGATARGTSSQRSLRCAPHACVAQRIQCARGYSALAVRKAEAPLEKPRRIWARARCAALRR